MKCSLVIKENNIKDTNELNKEVIIIRYGKHLNHSNTPQSQPLLGKDMVKNAAGGYAHKISNWATLTRFLILGSEGGTYYASEKKLTLKNVTNVLACIKEDGIRVVNEIVAISDAGRAVKNDPAIFALALCMKYGDEATRKLAYSSLPSVCRIGTHLFTLADSLNDIDKGWGRGLKRAVANWYLYKKSDNLAYQMAKYQQRNGWSQKDMLRLSHPKTKDDVLNAVFKWSLKGEVSEKLPRILLGFEKAKQATTVDEVVELISTYDLPRECVPTQFLTDVKVWRALLPKMPLTAMIRNLGNMTKSGLLDPGTNETQDVVNKLSDAEYIRKSRVHPITILMAMKQYQSGRGLKGSNSWTPVPKIVSALDKAFYMAFSNVEATGKKFFLGIDVSGSMSWANDSILTAAECAAAMAMTIMKTEPKYWAHGFSTTLVDLGINDSMSLSEVLQRTSNRSFGGTDAAVAIEHATKNNLDVDVFVVITDNETWAGRIHPSVALQEYRKKMNKPNAKLIVLGVTATECSIADPDDPNMIDIAGFDASVPQAISEFVKI